MRVLLRDRETKLYCAGPLRWVASPSEAMDFKKIERAAKAYEHELLTDAEIVLEDTPEPEGPKSNAAPN